MALTVDADHPGTPEQAWRRSGRLADSDDSTWAVPARWSWSAPHPDDEVLGAGGLVRGSSSRGSGAVSR